MLACPAFSKTLCRGKQLAAGTEAQAQLLHSLPSLTHAHNQHPHREAAVHGIGSAPNLSKTRAAAKAAGGGARPQLLGPRPRAPQKPTWDGRLGLYTLPFPGEHV